MIFSLLSPAQHLDQYSNAYPDTDSGVKQGLTVHKKAIDREKDDICIPSVAMFFYVESHVPNVTIFI